jgi:hypothetical protein
MSLADAEAQLSVRQRFRIAKARSQRLLARGKPDQPRDSNGKWTSGGDAGDDGDAEGKAQFDSRKDFLSDEAWNSDWELHNKIYGVLIDAADSGPYDGGCVIMAQALQKVVGGDVVGLTSANGRVQHAVVKTGDTYHDYSGSGSLKAVMGHLNKLESLDPAHRVVAARPMKKDDLPGAPRDDTVASEIASLIKMHKAIRSLNEKLFDESQHPRDDHGRWTDAGGGDDGDGESKPSGGEHPGEGYSAQATLKDGVIHTSNVYDAVRALHEGRKVELDQPRTVSVLLDKLGEIAKDMIAKGEKAPTFDLCNVTIKGTNLFCADAKGIPRVEMPQLTKQQDEPFFKYLQAQGHSIEREEQYASYLRATQAELNGAKVSAIAAAMRSAAGYDSNPIFVSNDDYILDGHHRWAAEIGNDARDNVLGNDKKMAIFRVDMNIIQLMEEAEKFTGGEGKLSVADEARRKAWLAARARALALLRAFDPSEPRDDAGKWTDGGGGGGDGDKDEAPAPAASAHNISGLPHDIVVKDRLMDQAIERGVWDMKATVLPKDKYRSGRERYNVDITAKIPPGIVKFNNRPGTDRVGYYNPKLAELFTVDKGEQYLERTYARPLPGFSQEIEPIHGKDIIYRGMRAEEYEKFQRTGEIVSSGDYNMEGQEGLTYWATDPGTAVSYANGFEKPAYVVATKMPKETRKVAGTGENEVGVARAITKDEIVGVWRGDVYMHLPGDQDLNPTSYDPDEKTYEAGSGSGPSSSVVWQYVSDKPDEIEDPEAVPTPEQEAANRTERARPENVSEYELPRINFSSPYGEHRRGTEKFESEAEYKKVGDALTDYKKATGDGDAYAVNRTLRGKEEMVPRIQQAIDNIDLGFTRAAAPIINYKTKQPKDAWLYRGISNRTQFELKEGDEFVDDGFGSTTIYKSFAQEWARSKGAGGTMVKITAPAGTKVLPVMDSSSQDEGEVLLNRGTRFRVTKVDGRNIEMTVLP